jgi:hypothetical protein
MQFIVLSIIICITFILFIETYKEIKGNPNEKLIKNMEKYAKKKKIEQQKSKILGQKSFKRTANKEKNTCVHN